MSLTEFLSLLSGIASAAPLIALAARAAIRRARRSSRGQVVIQRCAIDARPVPSAMSREFKRWVCIPGTGFICPQCQRLLPP
jgi:hypothetical protein